MDIIDVLFEWILNLFALLVKVIIKICGWILLILWTGIKALFGWIAGLISQKKDMSSDVAAVSASEVFSDDGSKMKSYDELRKDIESISIYHSDDISACKNLLLNTLFSMLLDGSLSFAQKARLLKQGDELLAKLNLNPADRFAFYAHMISIAYDVVNHMTDNAVQFKVDQFKAGLDSQNQEVELESLEFYLTDIMSMIAALNSPNGKVSFRKEMLEGVDLPACNNIQ